MTPWLNRGAKKTNEPTIPLIFQRFGWLNRAALAGAARPHDRSFAPNRIPLKRSGDGGQPPPRRRQRVGLIAGADRRRSMSARPSRARGK
jgi:hypothetical protein